MITRMVVLDRNRAELSLPTENEDLLARILRQDEGRLLRKPKCIEASWIPLSVQWEIHPRGKWTSHRRPCPS
jgi:hypothetical protein